MKPKAARRAGRKRDQKPTLAHIAFVETKNPLFNPSHPESSTNPTRIQSPFDMRESYVGYLWVNGTISDAEKKAADKIRHAYEALGGSGAGSIDHAKEKVDGGKSRDPITQRQADASKVLREVMNALGPQGHDLMIRACGQGEWPNANQRDFKLRNYYSMRVRECLEYMAVFWGYRTRPIVFDRMAG